MVRLTVLGIALVLVACAPSTPPAHTTAAKDVRPAPASVATEPHSSAEPVDFLFAQLG